MRFIVPAGRQADAAYAAGITGRSALPRWLSIVSGVISIIGGIVVFTLPGLAIVTFVIFGGWILIAIGIATLFSLPAKKGADAAAPVEVASA